MIQLFCLRYQTQVKNYYIKNSTFISKTKKDPKTLTTKQQAKKKMIKALLSILNFKDKKVTKQWHSQIHRECFLIVSKALDPGYLATLNSGMTQLVEHSRFTSTT